MRVLIEKCFTTAHCERFMSCADLNIFPQFSSKNSSVHEKQRALSQTVVLLSQLVLLPVRSPSRQPTGCVLYVAPANRRPVRAEVITAACRPYGHFALQRRFWSFAFLAACQKAVNLIEAGSGKQKCQGNTVSSAGRFSVVYSGLVITALQPLKETNTV